MSSPAENPGSPEATPIRADGELATKLAQPQPLGALRLIAVVSTLLLAWLISYGVREALGFYAFAGLTYYGVIWAVLAPVWGWVALRRYRASLSRSAAVSLLVLAAGVATYLVGSAAVDRMMTSKRKAVLFRQITAAMDQYFLEHGTTVVEEYEDLIGPTAYIRSQHSADGEEFRTMFPLYQFTPALSVRLSDGTLVSYPGSYYDLPIDPPIRFAPAEPFYPPGKGKPADGVYRKVMADGTTLEVSYRDGVPHGPFRFYLSNGTLGGEGLYEDGLPVSTRRHQPQHRPKSANTAEIEAQAYYVRGLNRLFTDDFKGAIERFDRAIDLNPNRPEAFEFRGRAKLKRGEWVGACGDFLRGAATRRANRRNDSAATL